jgi:[acyl-carrier-protein] S-malonyltransferase
MRAPAAEFAAHVERTPFRDATVPVVTNVSATSEREAKRLRELLVQQIASPVRWADSMRTLRTAWDGPVLEVGTGSVLKGLLRRIDRTATCLSVGDAKAVEEVLEKPLPSEADRR